MMHRTCIAILLSLLDLAPFVVVAQETGRAPLPFNSSNNSPRILPGFYGTFENVVGWIFVVAIVLGVLTFIVSGLMYVTAGRDPAKGSRAAKIAMGSVIGISIAALAWALVNVVGNYAISNRLLGQPRF